MTETKTGNDTGNHPLLGPGGSLGPFRHPAFRAIWIANLASNLGGMIQAVAAAWLMTELTSSHQLVALVQASVTVPILLLGMFAGAIADNFDRRLVMLTAQFGMLATSALLAALSYAGNLSPFVLLALTLTVGIGTTLNAPAWQASVRQQVGLVDLPQAIALNTISFNLARSVGPALGGLLISLWDTSLAFAINASSYIVMITVLLRWRPEVRKVERQPMLPAIAVGLRFCAASSPIRRVLLRGMIIGFGLASYQALVPILVSERLHGDEIDFGLVLGLFGTGSIVAALFISKLRRRFGVETVLMIGTVVFILALLCLAWAHTVAQAAPASFLAGTAWVATLTTLNVAMQVRSPDHILGRCLSVYQAITFGGMAIGSWVWGALSDWRDLPFALHMAAGFLMVTLILVRRFAPMPKPGEGRIEG